MTSGLKRASASRHCSGCVSATPARSARVQSTPLRSLRSRKLSRYRCAGSAPSPAPRPARVPLRSMLHRRLGLTALESPGFRSCFRREPDPLSTPASGCDLPRADTGARVVAVPERPADSRGLPASITVDHGPEFAGKALDAWAYVRGIRLSFIRPGKPIENDYVESFNARCRDECLNERWFERLTHARRVIEQWRIEYNSQRPHSALGNRTPEQYAREQCISENHQPQASFPPRTKLGEQTASPHFFERSSLK